MWGWGARPLPSPGEGRRPEVTAPEPHPGAFSPGAGQLEGSRGAPGAAEGSPSLRDPEGPHVPRKPGGKHGSPGRKGEEQSAGRGLQGKVRAPHLSQSGQAQGRRGHQCHRHLEDKSTTASCSPVTKHVLLFCYSPRPRYKPESILSLEVTPGAAGHGPEREREPCREDGGGRRLQRAGTGTTKDNSVGTEVHGGELPDTPKALTRLPAGPPGRPGPGQGRRRLSRESGGARGVSSVSGIIAGSGLEPSQTAAAGGGGYF